MPYIAYSNYPDIADMRTPACRIDAPKNVFERLAQAIEAKRIERANIKALETMGEHALFDIGIQRSEIRDLARTAAANPGIDYRSLR